MSEPERSEVYLYYLYYSYEFVYSSLQLYVHCRGTFHRLFLQEKKGPYSPKGLSKTQIL